MMMVRKLYQLILKNLIALVQSHHMTTLIRIWILEEKKKLFVHTAEHYINIKIKWCGHPESNRDGIICRGILSLVSTYSTMAAYITSKLD